MIDEQEKFFEIIVEYDGRPVVCFIRQRHLDALSEREVAWPHNYVQMADLVVDPINNIFVKCRWPYIDIARKFATLSY